MPTQLKSLALAMLLSVVTIQTTAQELDSNCEQVTKVENYDVGPIYNNSEASRKANSYAGANLPESCRFNGQWWSTGGSSTAQYNCTTVTCAAPEFQKMSINAEMTGWRMASVEEVEQNLSAVTNMLGVWGIAQLACGYKVDGSGYGNKILKIEPDCLANSACAGGEQIVIRSTQSTVCPAVEPVCVEELVTKVETYDVGPIYSNQEASRKANSYAGANLPESCRFNGQWWSTGGSSLAQFNCTTTKCAAPVEPVCVPELVTKVETYDVGPIYSNSEASRKANSYAGANLPESCRFNGQWWSENGSSKAQYNCTTTKCTVPVVPTEDLPTDYEQPISADDLSSIEEGRNKRRQIEANLETPIVDMNVAVGVPNVVPNFIPAPKASVIVGGFLN